MSDYNDKMRREAMQLVTELESSPLTHRRPVYGQGGRITGHQQLDYADPSAMKGQLAKMYEKADSTLTGQAKFDELRKLEIARAYVDVSDGKGGLLRVMERDYGAGGYKADPERVHPNAMERFKAAVDGHLNDANKTPLPSQRMAVEMGKPHLLPEGMQKRFGQAARSDVAERVTVGALKSQRGHVTGKFAAVLAAGAAVVAIAAPALSHITKPEAQPQEKVTMDALVSSRGALAAQPEPASRLESFKQKLQTPKGP